MEVVTKEEYLQAYNHRCPNCCMRFQKPYESRKKCMTCNEKLPAKLAIPKRLMPEEEVIPNYAI